MFLFSNHKTSRLGAWVNSGRGLRLRAAGEPPVFINLASADHRTIFCELFVEKVYDLNFEPFLPTLIVDCGAHIGLFSRLAVAAYPEAKVYAFEPNPENFVWLKKQTADVSGHVNLIQAGVDVAEGQGLLLGSGCQGSISHDQNSVGGVQVPLVDLGAWVKNLPRSEALLIKMDIEGKEFEVFPHILPVLPPNTALLFETHSLHGDCPRLVSLLEDNGFAVQQVRSRTDSGKLFCDFRAIRAASAAVRLSTEG